MALAPHPTTTIDGVDIFAAPTRSATPRNAWLAIEYRNADHTPLDRFQFLGRHYGYEMFGGATRSAVQARCTGNLSRLAIIETAKHAWRPTRHNRTPF